MGTGENLPALGDILCCVCDTDIASLVKKYSQSGRDGEAFTSNLRSWMILTRSAWPESLRMIMYTIIAFLSDHCVQVVKMMELHGKNVRISLTRAISCAACAIPSLLL
jgi:hypothetical protein